MVSAAVAFLPAAVSLLLLEALFMQISWVSLALTWPLRLCLLRVLLCVSHCYKLSSFQAHWGRWHCTCFSGRHVYLQFTWEVGLPPSPVEFSSHCCFYKFFRFWLLGVCCSSCPPACLFTAHVGSGSSPCPVEFSSLHHLYKLSCSWLLLLLPSPAWLVYLVLGGIPIPRSLALRVPHPLCYVSLLFLLLITQFLFFSLGGDRSVQGAMLIWPRVFCGSTMYHLAHLVVCVFPSHLSTGIWPPGFSI
jgi:hypothetical protein